MKLKEFPALDEYNDIYCFIRDYIYDQYSPARGVIITYHVANGVTLQDTFSVCWLDSSYLSFMFHVYRHDRCTGELHFVGNKITP